MKFEIYFAGVGGLGGLTTSAIVARAANYEGHFVRGLQLHGLAQRSGSTISTVRFGSKKEVISPTIRHGEADLIIALEPLEALNVLNFSSKRKTNFIVNTYKIIPIYSYIEGIEYPPIDKILDIVKKYSKNVYKIDAYKISREKFGNIIYGNLMMLGLAVGKGIIPLKKESLIKAIKETVKYNIEKNIAAFNLGLEMD